MASPYVQDVSNVFEDTIGSTALVSGDLVYNDGTDWEKADADLVQYATAFVVKGGQSGVTGTFATHGILVDTDAPYIINNLQYLSTTPGLHTETAPVVAQVVGIALTTSAVRLSISPPPGDNDRTYLGKDRDIALAHSAAAIAANTAVTDLLLGTPVAQATAGNSLIISNLTASGDIAIYGNLGGNSQQYLFIDVSAAQLFIDQADVHVMDAQGVVVGHTAQITFNALIPEFQVLGTTVGVDGAMAVGLYSSTASEGPEITLGRSKSGTLGTNTIVASGDVLGTILFVGADGGTGFDPAASIRAEVDGTPGVLTDMPGRLLFLTSPDGSQTQTEVFRVASDQNLYVVNNNGVVIGHTAQLTMGGTGSTVAEMQVIGTTVGVDMTMAVAGFSTSAGSGPAIALVRSNSGTIGTATAVADNQLLGNITAFGADGTDLNTQIARIEFEVDDASPGTGTIGGAIILGVSTTNAVGTGMQEVLRINSARDTLIADGGGLVVGHTAQIDDVSTTPEFQVLCTAAADGSILLGLWSATAATSPKIRLLRNKNATIGSYTIVADNDQLGSILWHASDAVDNQTAVAEIRVDVDDAAPAASDIGVEMLFQLASGTGADDRRTVLTLSPDGAMALVNGAPKFTLGTVSAFATTQPTNTLVLRAGTAPAGSITTAVGLFTDGTSMKKIIADGTVTNVET